jgi:tRNA threonylcarbamoyl adenosine modification protein YeaZ
LRPDGAILAFDTAGPHCAVAVVAGGGRVIAAAHEPMARGQAERLIPMVEAVMAGAGIGWGDLGGIGVGTGPGNFTGVRIAVAAARGMALARGLPAVGVSRFEAAAEGRNGRWLVVVPGREGMVAAQAVEDGTGTGPAIELACGKTLPADFAAACVGVIDVAGAPLPPLPSLPQAAGAGMTAPLVIIPVPEPEAAPAIGRLAAARIAAGRVTRDDGPRPAPLYLRPPDATPPARPGPPMLP